MQSDFRQKKTWHKVLESSFTTSKQLLQGFQLPQYHAVCEYDLALYNFDTVAELLTSPPRFTVYFRLSHQLVIVYSHIVARHTMIFYPF